MTTTPTQDVDEPTANDGYPFYSEGFLLDEDRALHRHLKGLSVYDDAKNHRPVGVWFSQPDMEIRDQRYPYMVISLLDVTEAKNRVMTGTEEQPVPNFPEEFLTLQPVPVTVYVDSWGDEWSERRTLADFIDPVMGHDGGMYNANGTWADVWLDTSSSPIEVLGPPAIPAQIDYVVRAYSRHPRHSRQIVRDFIGRKVAYRYSYLDMSDIDGTNRRMELLDVAHMEMVEDSKKLFMSSFTIRVDGFMPVQSYTVREKYSFVTKVVGTLHAYRNNRDKAGNIKWDRKNIFYSCKWEWEKCQSPSTCAVHRKQALRREE